MQVLQALLEVLQAEGGGLLASTVRGTTSGKFYTSCMALIWPTKPPYSDEGQDRLQLCSRFDIPVTDPSWWGWETTTDPKEDRPYT